MAKKKIYLKTFYNLALDDTTNAKFLYPFPKQIKVMAEHKPDLYVINIKRGCFWRTGHVMDGKDIRKHYRRVI